MKQILLTSVSIHHTGADVLFLKGLVEAGKFRPLIDRSYPLEQLRDAYTYVTAGQKIGNVVIRVREEAAG